jgi:hypothetical protein
MTFEGDGAWSSPCAKAGDDADFLGKTNEYQRKLRNLLSPAPNSQLFTSFYFFFAHAVMLFGIVPEAVTG